MRTGTAAFNAKARSPNQSPRFVIEQSFDPDNTILWYFTSHADAATPQGASVISSVISALSVFSQRLDFDKANSTIGEISYRLIDRANLVSEQLGAQLQVGRSLRRMRMRVYEGFEGLAWSDYLLRQTQVVDKIRYDKGAFEFLCADIQRAMRKDIFDLATTTLAASCDDTQNFIDVYDTSKYQLLTHGSSFSDAPNQTVGYFKLEDEIIRYTGKTSTRFTGCTRGALNTLPAKHTVDDNASPDQRQKVEEYVYLEMPAVKLAYAILTGRLLRQSNSAVFPATWNLGIPEEISAEMIVDGDLLHPDLVFARASTASYFDKNGVLKTAAADQARVEYDPVTGERRGLLIEESRTNLITQSEDFSAAGWLRTGILPFGSGSTVNAARAPDGAITMDRLVEDTSNGVHETRWSQNVTAGLTYAGSVFLEAGERTKVILYLASTGFSTAPGVLFDLVAGTATTFQNPGSIVDFNIEPCGNGIYRCWLSGVATNTAAGTFFVRYHNGGASYVGDGVSGAYMWGGQIEVGPKPSSYMKTAGATFTRAADNATIPLGSWFNAAEGTLYAEFDIRATSVDGTARVIAAIGDSATFNETIYLSRIASNGNVAMNVQDGGVAQVSSVIGAVTPNVLARAAFGYKLNDFAGSLNGAAVVTDTSGTLPTVNTLAAGKASWGAGNYLNGHIRRLAYLPQRLSNADLQTLSSTGVLPILDAGYVRKSDFLNIGQDLWNPADDQQGFIVRFEGETKTDGKEFIERQINLLVGCFMPVYADGALGLRRAANVLAGAAYVAMLDPSNIVSFDALEDDFDSLHNIIQIDWDYDPIQKETRRSTSLVDPASIVVHGQSDPYFVTMRGLHGSRHSNVILKQRFDAFRDRYTGPPLRHRVVVLPTIGAPEAGDIFRVRNPHVQDFVANGTLDRSFEVQQVQTDEISGRVTLDLFASSQAPGAIAPTDDAIALTNAFYSSQGVDLATVLTISGANPGHVTANGNLTGAADLNSALAIYFYAGDLVIDAGVTVTINNNVQLRVLGNLTINGTIDGKGRGRSGAAQISSQPTDLSNAQMTRHNDGTPGFLGSPKSAGGFISFGSDIVLHQFDGWQVVGANVAVPAAALSFDGTSLQGIFSDMRGSSGSSGNCSAHGRGRTGGLLEFSARGGAGGPSGAGLVVIARGVTFGAAGKIDLSGGDGSLGETYAANGNTNRAGSGAGGAPGGCLVIIDGPLSAVPILSASFVANYGKTPIAGTPVFSAAEGVQIRLSSDNYPYYVGQGDGTTFPLPSLSGNGGGCRIQFAPANSAAQPSPAPAILSPPGSLTLSSGTAELLVNGDGTIVPRIKATWTQSTDARVLGYELRFKESAGTAWQYSSIIFEQTIAWLSPVKDGIAYDVQIRSVGAARQVSIWIPVSGHTVLGKTAPPSDVAGLTASQNSNVVVFGWDAVTDADLAGYELRYGPRATATWDNAIPITKISRGEEMTSAAIPPGDWRFFVKARDTSGNYAVNAATTDLVVSSALDVIYQRAQAPDWLGNRIASFDGINDTASVPYNALFDFERTDAFSIILRVKTPSSGNAGFVRYIGKTAVTTGRGYHIYHDATTGQVGFKISNTDNSNTASINTTTSIADDQWKTIVATYDGSSAAAGMKLYINGALATTAVGFNTLSSTILSTENLYFGSIRGVGGFMTHFAAEAWIYKRVVSAQEASDVHQGKTLSSANLIGHWNFAENDGATVYDDSGNLLHATLSGPTLVRDHQAHRFVKHWTGVVVPDSTKMAGEMTNAELFEQFVPYAFTRPIYHAPQIDIGFDDTCRIWAAMQAALGRGVISGIAAPALEVDFRKAADPYDGYEPWTIGDRTGRYFKHRAVLDTSVGKAQLTGMLPTVDQLEDTDQGTATIAPGGTTVNFSKIFHVAPLPQVTVVSGAALYAVISNVTTTGFSCKIFNSGGVDVGGTINWQATGV